MPRRREAELTTLLAAVDPEAYLLRESHLAGPRANLELLDAAGDVLDRAMERAAPAEPAALRARVG